jgi:hypothetical protein
MSTLGLSWDRGAIFGVLVFRIEGIRRESSHPSLAELDHRRSIATARRAAATAARNRRSGHAAWGPVPTRRPGRPTRSGPFAPPAGDSELRDGEGHQVQEIRG